MKTIHPNDLSNQAAQYTLIDVRRPDEFNGDLGHIEGAQLITLGPALLTYLEKTDKETPIVFICRSGSRSGQATEYSEQIGFKNTYNMEGGMILWNMLGLKVLKI